MAMDYAVLRGHSGSFAHGPLLYPQNQQQRHDHFVVLFSFISAAVLPPQLSDSIQKFSAFKGIDFALTCDMKWMSSGESPQCI